MNLKIMLKAYTFLAFCVKMACGLDAWVFPDPQLRYDEVSFLTAHNAFANFNEGWKQYMMQTWSIEEQLDHGVRGIMLDTHEGTDGTIRLCHGGCGAFHTLQKGIGLAASALWQKHEYESLVNTLTTIKKWLDKHPSEIVTLFLENRVDNEKLAQEIASIKGFLPMVLKLNEWDPSKHDGKWPTISWMRAHNKRIIIFNEDKTESELSRTDGAQKYTYPFAYSWHYLIESRYGSVDKHTVCAERTESELYRDLGRFLLLLNFFRQITGPLALSARDNSYQTLKELVAFCKEQGLAHGKNPNFIALDFVEEGNAIKLINELNAYSRKKVILRNGQCAADKTCQAALLKSILKGIS